MKPSVIREAQPGPTGEWTCRLEGGPGDGLELHRQVPWPAIRVLETASSHEYERVSRDDAALVAVYRWQVRSDPPTMNRNADRHLNSGGAIIFLCLMCVCVAVFVMLLSQFAP